MTIAGELKVTAESDSTRDSLPLPLTAIVLCGGRSRRMGRPKAFLPYEGSTVIAHVVETVRDLFQEVFLVSNEPESYEDLGVDVVKDILPYRGPMGGILSGLLVSGLEHSFVLACDMPLVSRPLIHDMTEARHGWDVVVLSHDRGIEPLLGIYSKNCIKPMEEALFSGSLSVQEILGGLKTTTFRYEDEPGAGIADDDLLPAYFNVNTPQDYSRLITGGSSVHKFPERRRS